MVFKVTGGELCTIGVACIAGSGEVSSSPIAEGLFSVTLRGKALSGDQLLHEGSESVDA